MKKQAKKIIAICLSAALIAGFCITGSMAEESEFWNAYPVNQNSECMDSIDEQDMVEDDGDMSADPDNQESADDHEEESGGSDSEGIENASSDDMDADTADEEAGTASDDLSIETAELKITGSFDAIEGQDIASIRYYNSSDGKSYSFASFSKNDVTGKYDYEFNSPYNGFTAIQGTESNGSSLSQEGATVIAYYYNLNKWDGAVDVSWYDDTSKDFYLSTPAQLAGLAAIVNGSINTSTPVYAVKGVRTDLSGSANNGLPDCIQNKFVENASLPGKVTGDVYQGLIQYDFSNRTIHLTSDMDMGGVDGSTIDQSANSSVNIYSYPNWTPIGGEYLMDVSDDSTMIIASFNGTLDGGGHHITNLYCYRWSYNHPEIPNYTAYGYAQGTGLIGMMASLYDGEESPDVSPAVRNLSLSGYVYGRRMVGGIVGCVGGGSSAASGTTADIEVCLENLANHAYVYCTDSKGIGGIVATSFAKGTIVNCYNTGNLNTTYGYPTGGIIASNEEMDVYCCYNTGKVTSSSHNGRGIGSDNSGKNYTIDNCYYLEGCGDDATYPGYYLPKAPDSVSVNVTSMTETQMKNGELLAGLNSNGTAYVQGDDGYPVLWWEKNSGTGDLTVKSCEGGSVTASKSGSMPNGTIVYLSNSASTGWNFRNYIVNDRNITADCITVNGNTTVTAGFESAQPGTLKIAQNVFCDISVTKDGIVMEGGNPVEVTDYPVNNGDPVYEGDTLIVNASIISGKVPADTDYIYAADAGESNPFTFSYTYTGKDPVTTSLVSYKVTSDISGEGTQLTLDVIPRTIHKRWTQIADTKWYNDESTSFTLTTAAQLAGLDAIVEAGNTFSGKTILIGKDISLANSDGTNGVRYWDGIGNDKCCFSGTFDGQGHNITDMTCDQKGLFAYVSGTADNNANVKNISVWGTTQGNTSAGIVCKGKYVKINGCSSYVCINDGVLYTGGILAYDTGYCTLDDCFNYARIEGSGSTGGIVGELKYTSTVVDCINTGEINGEGTTGGSIGGLVGSLCGKLNRCANYGNVISWGRHIGGITGESVSEAAEITDCYNVGTVSCTQKNTNIDAIGGLIGMGSYYRLINSFNYGNVLISEDFTSTYIGGIVGQEMARSSSSSSNTYFLDTSCDYAENSKTISELVSSSYTAGMKSADAENFASEDGVMSGINGNSSFLISNGKYPELDYVSSKLHVHSGGKATCSKKAVCEVCGLSYGTVDLSSHGETEVINASPSVWTTDGYTGDVCCADCGTVITKGSVIKADVSKEAISVTIKCSGKKDVTRTYTVEQLDALKTTGTIGYSYGRSSNEMMAATEYVTIETLIGNNGYSMDSIESLQVVCDSSSPVISGETLRKCAYYYDSTGSSYSSPAAIAITYATYKGTLEEASDLVQTYDLLRFGYGMSTEQYENNTTLGGNRCVSPVRSLIFTVTGEQVYSVGDVDMNGSVDADDLTRMARHLAMIEVITDKTALSLADTDGNGTFDADDLTHLARYLAHIISEL